MSSSRAVVSPGPINTPLAGRQSADVFARIVSTIPMGRMGEPEEVGLCPKSNSEAARCGSAAGCEAGLRPAVGPEMKVGCAPGSGSAPIFMGQRPNQGPSPIHL